MRAINSGISLNEKDAGIVKGMLERGDRQHDIASWFGVNGGRIAEISVGKKFSYISADRHDLPPRGPYLSGMDMMRVKEKVKSLNDEISRISKKLSKDETNNIVWLKNDIIIMKNKINNIYNDM